MFKLLFGRIINYIPRYNNSHLIYPDVVMKGQQQLENYDFKQKCINNINKCKKCKNIFHYSDFSLKLISSTMMTLAGLLGGFYGIKIGIIVGVIGSFLSILSFLLKWAELKEKYSQLKLDFEILSTSNIELQQRLSIYNELESKLENVSLASDIT